MDYLRDLNFAFDSYLEDQALEDEEDFKEGDPKRSWDQQHWPMAHNRELIMEWRRRMHIKDPGYREGELLWSRDKSELRFVHMEEALIGFLLLLLDGSDPQYEVWEFPLTHKGWLQIVAMMLFRYAHDDRLSWRPPSDVEDYGLGRHWMRARGEHEDWRCLQRSTFDLAVEVVRDLGGPTADTHCFPR